MGLKSERDHFTAGVVGVVAQVSPSYSMGLSILNQRWSVSAKLSKTGFLFINLAGMTTALHNLPKFPCTFRLKSATQLKPAAILPYSPKKYSLELSMILPVPTVRIFMILK